MYATTLNLLLEGAYICPVAFAQAYEQLDDPAVAGEIDETLGRLNMRLARVNEDGAFFMAPAVLQAQHTARVREELLRFRDVYGPAVRMLNLMRLAKDDLGLRMGETVQLAELEQAINNSSSLESQLRGLHGVVSGTVARNSNRDFLKKLLENLRWDGFLVLSNAQTETYRVTGKIEQIHSVLEFIAEQVSITVEDKIVEPGDDLDLKRSSPE